MKNDPEIYKKANGFDKNPQNINRNGRPKKVYTVLKELGYSADDIKTAFGELAWYEKTELTKIKIDEEKPIIVRIVANQFLTALKDDDWQKIRDILEHIVGKPTQTIQASLGATKKEIENIFPKVKKK